MRNNEENLILKRIKISIDIQQLWIIKLHITRFAAQKSKKSSSAHSFLRKKILNFKI